MKNEDLTPAETMVMKSIWDAEREITLSEIVETVNERFEKTWKPQTVSTFLSRLAGKGFVSTRREGRRIFYEVLVTEEQYKTAQEEKFVAFWNRGSVGQFLTAFYKEKKITPMEVEELRRVIDELDE